MRPDTRHETLRAVSDALYALRRFERQSGSGDTPACGVTASQGMLVHEVALAGPGGATTSELAARMGISSSAVTQLVDGCVEAGILERAPDPEDGRRTRIALTDHGGRLYALFDEARLAQAESLFATLSDAEVGALARLLRKAVNGR